MKKEPRIYKTFRQEISIDKETESTLNFLSTAMIHLWNLAVSEAEWWLFKNSIINTAKKHIKDPGNTDLAYEFRLNLLIMNDFAEVFGTTIVVKKSLTPITFNYWHAFMAKVTKVTIEGKETLLADISSDLSRQLLVQLAGGYQSFFELKKKGDSRARKPEQQDLENNRFQILTWSTAKRDRNKILLPVGKNKPNLEIEIPNRLLSEIYDKDIVYTSVLQIKGKFYLKFVISESAPERKEGVKFVRAVDLGAGDIAVTDSDGSEFLIPARRPDKYWGGQISNIKARIGRCTKGSRAYTRRNNSKIKVYAKGEYQRRDYQRKLTDALLEDKVDCIVVSKANTRLGLAQSEDGSPEQHSGVQQTGYMHRMIVYIKEMAEKAGVRVIEIPDPKREGPINDPQSKFNASRELLNKAIGENGFSVVLPSLYKQKKFAFTSSSGAGENEGKREEKRKNVIMVVKKVMAETLRNRRKIKTV